MTDDERRGRAAQARRLLEDPLLRAVLLELEQESTERSIAATTVEEREAQRADVHALRRLAGRLAARASDMEVRPAAGEARQVPPAALRRGVA